jgi:hypothetical protein
MTPANVTVRRIPFPYRAMLAVCSDLDETPDRRIYWELMRFLNTTETTSLGPGAGLEVANSIYFDMPADQFAYETTDDAGRTMIRTLIRSGHIDCLHSFGDRTDSRDRAARILDELCTHDCRLKIWVDHGTAVTNFGSDIMAGCGDVVGHPAYHADLTFAYGIRYLWKGRVTSLTSQDVSPCLGELLDSRHALASAKTLAKETAKRLLAHVGSAKYRLHLPNRVLGPITLRDGRPMYEFLRSNPYWGGVSSCETADGIGNVLTERVLRNLADHKGICILYTHLGKNSDSAHPMSPASAQGFHRLARYCHDGTILVATTYRVLNYLTVRNHLKFQAQREGNTLRITIHAVEDPVRGTWTPGQADLSGITFETEYAEHLEIRLDAGPAIPATIHQDAERTLATVPWTSLSFPQSVG